MTITPVSDTPQTQAVAPTDKTTQSAPKPAAKSTETPDTVQISSAALAAMKEASETPAQTAREAGAGDVQAQKLQAKQTAVAHPVAK